MKKTLLLILLFPLFTYGQSAREYFNLGTKKSESAQYIEAIDYFTQAIGLDGRCENAYHQRALSKMHLRDFKGAAADLTMVLVLNPKDSVAYKERSGLLGTEGKIAGYNDLIASEPTNAKAYQQRANAKYYVKDYTGCIKDNTNVIKLEPVNINAYANRATAKWAIKDYQGAIRDYTVAATLDKTSPWIYYNDIGIVELDLNDYKDALKNYNKSIKMMPSDGTYMNRGNVKVTLGDYKGAIADYTWVISRTQSFQGIPSHRAFPYEARGRAKRIAGDYQGSLSDYDQAISFYPDYARLYNDRGIVKNKLGDKDGACSDWQKAVNLGFAAASENIAKFCK